MYSFSLGPVEYGPCTLTEAWEQVHGVGCARIWCGERLVLERAGESVGRRYAVRRRFEAQRERRRQTVVTTATRRFTDDPIAFLRTKAVHPSARRL